MQTAGGVEDGLIPIEIGIHLMFQIETQSGCLGGLPGILGGDLRSGGSRAGCGTGEIGDHDFLVSAGSINEQ